MSSSNAATDRLLLEEAIDILLPASEAPDSTPGVRELGWIGRASKATTANPRDGAGPMTAAAARAIGSRVLAGLQSDHPSDQLLGLACAMCAPGLEVARVDPELAVLPRPLALEIREALADATLRGLRQATDRSEFEEFMLEFAAAATGAVLARPSRDLVQRCVEAERPLPVDRRAAPRSWGHPPLAGMEEHERVAWIRFNPAAAADEQMKSGSKGVRA